MNLFLAKGLFGGNSVSSNGSNVTINGVSYSGRDISMTDEGVFVDGVKQGELPEEKSIIVEVHGNVQEVSTTSGSVHCDNTSGNVITASGRIVCNDIHGNISTMSGDVSCDNIAGNVSTMSGDIL